MRIMKNALPRGRYAPGRIGNCFVQLGLARRGIGCGQPGVGSRPDARHVTAGAGEEAGCAQAYKSQQQCVLDQILALLVV